MYRIFLVANDPSARKEEWVDAVTVQEAGPLWEFRDSGGFVIRRLPKADVQSFTVTADRRQQNRSIKRRTYADQPQVDLTTGSAGRPIREKAVESSSRSWSFRSSSRVV
jgi:hypothetical protein